MILENHSEDETRKIEENLREENEFRKALSKILSGDNYLSSKPILIGATPNAIECCVEKKGLNLVIKKSVIKKCMKAEIRDKSGKQTRNSGHGLTEQQLNDVVWAIKRPVMILNGTKQNSVAVMTGLKDNEGRYIFAFIALDQIGATGNVNIISSIYGRNNLKDYFERCIKNNMVIAVNKEKVNDVCLSIGGHFSEATALINYDCTIAYTYNSVKQKNEA